MNALYVLTRCQVVHFDRGTPSLTSGFRHNAKNSLRVVSKRDHSTGRTACVQQTLRFKQTLTDFYSGPVASQGVARSSRITRRPQRKVGGKIAIISCWTARGQFLVVATLSQNGRVFRFARESEHGRRFAREFDYAKSVSELLYNRSSHVDNKGAVGEKCTHKTMSIYIIYIHVHIVHYRRKSSQLKEK